MNVTTLIIFHFDVAPVAGDSIAIPLEFRIVEPALVPEPATWITTFVGFAGLAAMMRMTVRCRRLPRQQETRAD